MVLRQTISAVTSRLDQEPRSLVEHLMIEGRSPLRFRQFIPELQDRLTAVGREMFVATVSELDELNDTAQWAGRTHRFKMGSPKRRLTPFGSVCLERRYFQPDSGGKGVGAARRAPRPGGPLHNA